jgi:hypothetical protein
MAYMKTAAYVFGVKMAQQLFKKTADLSGVMRPKPMARSVAQKPTLGAVARPAAAPKPMPPRPAAPVAQAPVARAPVAPKPAAAPAQATSYQSSGVAPREENLMEPAYSDYENDKNYWNYATQQVGKQHGGPPPRGAGFSEPSGWGDMDPNHRTQLLQNAQEAMAMQFGVKPDGLRAYYQQQAQQPAPSFNP